MHPPRFQCSGYFFKNLIGLENMLDHILSDMQINRLIGKRQSFQILAAHITNQAAGTSIMKVL